MSTLTILCTDTQINQIKTTFNDSINSTTPPYALFQCKVEGCVITAYQSKKVVFQGKDAEIYASSFLEQKIQSSSSETCMSNSTVPSLNKAHAGSDEVGTGDYFGPVCVCACIVTQENLKDLAAYDIQDSKAITDAHIMKIAPLLMKICTYSLLILDNKKYNAVHPTNNMNKIKAKLHNQAYYNLSKKAKLPSLSVVDQFAPKDMYYRYLSEETHVIHNLHFETKAESKYLAVACASMIARYAFLESLRNYEEHYKMIFRKGASDYVDKNAADFVHQFGIEELGNVAKLHFKNTEKLKEYL